MPWDALHHSRLTSATAVMLSKGGTDGVSFLLQSLIMHLNIMHSLNICSSCQSLQAGLQIQCRSHPGFGGLQGGRVHKRWVLGEVREQDSMPWTGRGAMLAVCFRVWGLQGGRVHKRWVLGDVREQNSVPLIRRMALLSASYSLACRGAACTSAGCWGM